MERETYKKAVGHYKEVLRQLQQNMECYRIRYEEKQQEVALESFVPGPSKQFLDNLTKQNARLRGLVGNTNVDLEEVLQIPASEIGSAYQGTTSRNAMGRSQQEMKIQIDLLHQQTAVAAEDFDRERIDRTRAQSYRDECEKKLKALNKWAQNFEQKSITTERQINTPEDILLKKQAVLTTTSDFHQSKCQSSYDCEGSVFSGVETVYQLLKQIKDRVPASVRRFTRIAYNVMCEAKLELQNLFGIDIITNEQPVQPEGQLSWIWTAMESLQTTKLTEKILTKVAGSVGRGWKHIMFELGLSSFDVDHCQMKHPNDPMMQIFEGLKTWMKRSSQPTVGSLLLAMEKCWRVNVDWDQLKGHFAGVAGCSA